MREAAIYWPVRVGKLHQREHRPRNGIPQWVLGRDLGDLGHQRRSAQASASAPRHSASASLPSATAIPVPPSGPPRLHVLCRAEMKWGEEILG